MVIVDLVQRIRVGPNAMVGARSGRRGEELLIIVTRAAEQEIDEIVIGGNVAFGLGLVVVMPVASERRSAKA
ncbi:hypothetical protein ACFSQQ_21335 [Mesorhizobium kowhaii]|uniref:hypothetical protein n=1 Tax=Mesorhizobium kowhaii TaxID=1300272 RepID=UPI0035E86430